MKTSREGIVQEGRLMVASRPRLHGQINKMKKKEKGGGESRIRWIHVLANKTGG